MLAHRECLLPVNDIYCSYGAYLLNAIDRGTEFQFSENQTAASLEGFIFYVSLRQKEALSECSCP